MCCERVPLLTVGGKQHVVQVQLTKIEGLPPFIAGVLLCCSFMFLYFFTVAVCMHHVCNKIEMELGGCFLLISSGVVAQSQKQGLVNFKSLISRMQMLDGASKEICN